MTSTLDTLLTLILSLGGVNSLSRSRCPSGWVLNGQSCWLALPNKANVSTARAECNRMDSYLAVPNSETENDFVYSLFKQTWPNARQSLWLDCWASLPNNTLTCTESLTGYEKYFTFDGRDEPERRCVAMHKGRASRWFGVQCSGEKHTICERPAKPEAEAKTLLCSAISLHHPGQIDSPMVGSYCLLNQTFSVLQIKSPMECCIACFKDFNCHSFNLSGNKCKLNNVTISQVDHAEYFKQDGDCSYFEMKWA